MSIIILKIFLFLLYLQPRLDPGLFMKYYLAPDSTLHSTPYSAPYLKSG